MLIETLFLRLFELDQREIKEIVQEIVNIYKGAIFKNKTTSYTIYSHNFQHNLIFKRFIIYRKVLSKIYETQWTIKNFWWTR